MAAAPKASCIGAERGCVMFDCLVQLWEWLDPPTAQTQFPMENNRTTPATQQPLTQQHLMAHHVHPDQIYSRQPVPPQLNSPQQSQLQPNSVMHQLLKSQYQSNIDAKSPLLENRQHEIYGAGPNHEYSRHYGANDNYNYPQSPPRLEQTEIHTDYNVNHEILHNVPKGYNAEVYQDYLKRNPPKESHQIYQNHQPPFSPNVNQYAPKPYLPFSNRIGPQSNTELLRRQYNEIQQMKLQQQIHYQNQAQMHQQQKFAERQLLLQQIHGVQPPPNLQNSIYSDGSYRDLDQYGSTNDFKDYSSPDIQKDIDRYVKNNEYKEIDKHKPQYEESQWMSNQAAEIKETQRRRKQSESEKGKSPFSSTDFNNQNQKNNVGVLSPMKSSESSSPSIKSPSSDSRRSSSNQALRSPVAQRIPSAPVTMSGILYKQGSDGLKVWRKRWFVLSEYCLFYYKSQDEEKLLGSVLLPSYKVSACKAEDKVLRKFAFKLEHANMRTYILAAPDQDAMLKWVKALTMAALMQNSIEQPQKQSDRAAAKTEDDEEIPGPTYANAPPKPRRSNDGYNSPGSDMYDPNYDLLRKPTSHYSLSTSHTRYQEHSNYQNNQNQENTYSKGIQSPPQQQQPQYQSKRHYDTHQLSLPLTNTVSDKLDNSKQSQSSLYMCNNQNSPYSDNRNRQQQSQMAQKSMKGQIYESQPQRNPFLQNNVSPADATVPDLHNNERTRAVTEQNQFMVNELTTESKSQTKPNVDIAATYNKDVYGELNPKPNRANLNERLLIERRTPDAYGRSTTMSSYSKDKMGDYEDVYASYPNENQYGMTYGKLPNQPQMRDCVSVSSQSMQQQNHSENLAQEKTFSGPSVLRRKKMQSSGNQSTMPRPHSADFLEYESKQEILNSIGKRPQDEQSRQPQRPKSSLDINSYYDPSSEKFYSEENYAEKMRQSAQYLQRGIAAKNIQIPLAKYTSGLAEKQLHSPYSQVANNNYETEFAAKKINRDNISYTSKYSDLEGMSSNWTLKEKESENQKDLVNRSGSVMSDGSNISAFVNKDSAKFDQTAEGFLRSASARLPSTVIDKEGEKKVQQREESMKRLLEWKQRMLQSPLTRKSTPATISLARSLNQSRQSLRSDQHKSRTYTNASYNSYSSDDEEDPTETDLQKPRGMQAGRSQSEILICHNILQQSQPTTPHAISDVPLVNQSDNIGYSKNVANENTYENIVYHNQKISDEKDQNTLSEDDKPECEKTEFENIFMNDTEQLNNNCTGYETHESEAESETQIEYTDNDLDEVLQESDLDKNRGSLEKKNNSFEISNEQSLKSETPPVRGSGEEHYLPMTPRKTSIIEPPHKSILRDLSVFDNSMPQAYDDSPYVEMNLFNKDDDNMQTYEVVCVNNSKLEPVYMELNNISANDNDAESITLRKNTLDIASNFADTKDETLKRPSKSDKFLKDSDTASTSLMTSCKKSDCSDADDESSKDISLDTPFSRLSISDNFRPASYYLNRSKNVSDFSIQDSSDSDMFSPPPISHSNSSCGELSDEALSQYILDKLDKSDISQDNSILKMLTNASNKTNTTRRKATSLMIYGSHTSIHDTLSRGEKIRNNRANSANDRYKIKTVQSKLKESFLENQIQMFDTDSLNSYNADKESSRLSLESDVSSKFEITPSKAPSEVTSLNDSESGLDIRSMSNKQDDTMAKRRPVSEDSLFLLADLPVNCTTALSNIDLDRFLNTLQPIPTTITPKIKPTYGQNDIIHNQNISHSRANIVEIQHGRSSSTPVNSTSKAQCSGLLYENILEQNTLQVSSFSTNLTRSPPLSYYCKSYDEEEILIKNLKNEITADKIKEFDNTKLPTKSGEDTNASSSTTGFHSRDSSTEHSAPYYYSDLSSQEHINILPTSHYLKNTNLHRKLNNQRRKGPLQKKNEISHIHNPIHSNQTSNQPFELVASAQSVSVEFLSATVKDSEIDMKNIYESTGKHSKIPESMALIATLGFKKQPRNDATQQSVQNDTSSKTDNNLTASSPVKTSTTSMSSHCSGNSSNTVYYDAEADVGAYENVVCQGEKHWDEDSLWRDNLRRVSHRHARSMDDLDAVPLDNSINTANICGTNSIKRIKKDKISRNVTYVNCLVQNQVMKPIDTRSVYSEENESVESNDVYVSLAINASTPMEQSDEGVYEQLAVDTTTENVNSNQFSHGRNIEVNEKNKKKFEIDREKLRQWDLMSSGLMKGAVGRVRSVGTGMGSGDALCSTDSGADSASNEASMTISGANNHTEPNYSCQQESTKKNFLGSNTSIGRINRDINIPVRAVSPRVRWVEDKTSNDHYSSQQLTTSQQNLHAIQPEESWSIARSPSRASQQPIRAVSPRIRRNTENNEMLNQRQGIQWEQEQMAGVPSAGELLGRSHEELVLLLIQLRRRNTSTHRAIEHCCAQISSIEECLNSLKAIEREESIQRLEQLKMQLMELEHQYEKSKPLVQLVDNMVKLGSLYNRPGSTVERLERNQRLRHKVLAEHALEQQRWLESAAAGKPLETEAARARVAELWALEQELADEAAILQGLKTDKDTIESLLTGVRGKLDNMPRSDLSTSMSNMSVSAPAPASATQLEAELARVHAMLALNSKKLEQTVADNARLERELQHLRRALQAQRAHPVHPAHHAHSAHPAHATAKLEDEVSRVQQLVSDLQRQRQELSRAVRHLTHQSQALQTTHNSLPGKHRYPMSSSWQETNLDTGRTIDHGQTDYEVPVASAPLDNYEQYNVDGPLYVDTRGVVSDIISPLTSEDMNQSAFGNLLNVEKQEIKTVRIVKRESERRHRDRERSLQPMTDWSSNNITANLDQFLEEELIRPANNYTRASSVPRTDYSKFEEYYSKPQPEPPNYLRLNDKMSSMEFSPKYPSSPSLSNYDNSRDISSLSSSYHRSSDRSGYEKSMSISNQYLNSPTDSSKTLTNDPLSKTSSIGSLTRSHIELSPIFKSEAAKQIITEMSGDVPKNGSLHRRQVPKEKRRHNTAPHHLSAKTLNEMPKDGYNQDKMGRSLDDADMERALRAPPDVVRSAIAPQRFADSTIDQILAAPQKILIPERYIPEKPPELSPEEQQKRQEKVESIKKMLSSSSTDPNKSPDKEEKRHREHLLQMNQILARQVTEMSKIIAVKALEDLPKHQNAEDFYDQSPDVELPIYQQRDNFFT